MKTADFKGNDYLWNRPCLQIGMDMQRESYIDRIFEHMSTTVQMTRTEFDAFSSFLQLVELGKKDILIEPGMTAKTMNYIVSGCMRSYYLDEDLQEHTLQLGIEDWWINDLYSYLKEEPSNMYVEALEPTILIQLEKSDLDQLFEDHPTLANFFRVKIQNAYVALQNRTVESMSESARDRYVNFLKNFRSLEQRVPQYIVASYLGITPESLSRLRKRMAEE